jgi:hypothetical protein
LRLKDMDGPVSGVRDAMLDVRFRLDAKIPPAAAPPLTWRIDRQAVNLGSGRG